MRWSRWRALIVHLGHVAARAVLASAVLVLALALPLPSDMPWLFHMVYVPLAVLSFIIYIGKLLIDTFFYDHYNW